MDKRTINLLTVLAIVTSLVIGCSSLTRKNDKEPPYISTSQKSKDSLFILEVIKKSIKAEFEYFDNFKFFKIPMKKVSFWVDEIYYSPDSLKLIATVINREPNNQDTKSQNRDSSYYYDGFAFIGYRKTVDSPLVTYLFNYYTLHGWESYIQVKRLHKDQLEENLKDLGVFVWNDSLKNWEGVKFNYNIKDTLFWSNSVVWKKGVIIPDHYYTFEVKRTVATGDSTRGKPRMDGINLEYRND